MKTHQRTGSPELQFTDRFRSVRRGEPRPRPADYENRLLFGQSRALGRRHVRLGRPLAPQHGAAPLVQIIHAFFELRCAVQMTHISTALLVGDQTPIYAGASPQRRNRTVSKRPECDEASEASLGPPMKTLQQHRVPQWCGSIRSEGLSKRLLAKHGALDCGLVDSPSEFADPAGGTATLVQLVHTLLEFCCAVHMPHILACLRVCNQARVFAAASRYQRDPQQQCRCGQCGTKQRKHCRTAS